MSRSVCVIFRSVSIAAILGLTVSASAASNEDTSSALDSCFTGKEVLVKIDMPGSQKGIDLRFDKSAPMNWDEYSSRTKE
jgi:hypothetical protein